MSDPIGTGVRVGDNAAITGTARYVAGPAAVIALMEEDVSGLILVVHEAGATGVAPILPDALGVICTSGGPTSHLALVAKEYGVACVMAARLNREAGSIDGARLRIEADGSIVVAENAT